jgi:endonuclease III
LGSKQQIAQIIQRMLDEIIPNPQVPLIYETPFQLLVATLLSAQCTDARVNMVTPLLFRCCPTPYEMRKITIEELSSMILSCGLSNRKARALHEIANRLVEKFGGEVPSSFGELEDLPGVGHKTASCVVAHAFNQPAFPVDTHIFRLAKRWHLSSGKSVKVVEEDLKQLFPKECWARVHLQMILYARRFCRAKGHSEEACPICRRLFH